MTSSTITRRAPWAAALLATVITAQANAQCCPAPTTTFYQPAAVTAFSPVVPVARTGWYPGYWLDRVRARLWGAPATYVAAYPTTFVAASPTAHHAAFAPTYTSAFRPVHRVAAYAAPATTVAYAAPAPAVACPAPVAAATYMQPAMAQAVQAPAPCAPCAPAAVAVPGAAVAAPPPAVAVPGPAHAVPGPSPQPEPQRTYDPQAPAPALDPGLRVPDRPVDAQRPPEPEPVEETFNGTNDTNSTYFQAPKLFDPNDRTAQRSAAPVVNALYEKPVVHRQASYGPITRQQAELDAAGWVSVSR